MVSKMDKTVLVTGATGRISSLVCRELGNRGYIVKAFVLPCDPFVKRFEDVPREIIHGNLLDQESIEKAVAGCEMVAHLSTCMLASKDMDENT